MSRASSSTRCPGCCSLEVPPHPHTLCSACDSAGTTPTASHVRPRSHDQCLKSIAMLYQASVYHKSMLHAEWKKTGAWQQLRDQRLPRHLDASEWDAAVTELENSTRNLVSTEVEAEAARAALREALRRAKVAEAVATARRQGGIGGGGGEQAEVVRLVHTAASSLTSLMAARAARREAAELKEQTEQLQIERLQMQLQMEQLQRERLQREHVPAVHMPVASWPGGGGEYTEGSSGVSKADASATVTRNPLMWAAESEASTEAPSDYDLVRSQTAVPRLAATRVQANWRGAKARRTAI